MRVLDRKDLICEADLDEDDLEDVNLDTQASLEDYEDIIDTIENYRDYDEH